MYDLNVVPNKHRTTAQRLPTTSTGRRQRTDSVITTRYCHIVTTNIDMITAPDVHEIEITPTAVELKKLTKVQIECITITEDIRALRG
jgi:hypothetical protein